MDAVEFIKTRAKMCKNLSCGQCPLKFFCSSSFFDQVEIAEDGVSVVEQWTKEHPVKTRQSEFLKQWPEVTVDKHGICNLEPCNLCPSMLNADGCGVSRCDKCRRDFWLKEIE